MNYNQRNRKQYETKMLFEHQSRIHMNCIRLSTANSYEHEKSKFLYSWNLLKKGENFITEAVMEKPFRKRCDIVNISKGYIVEIVKSESKRSQFEKEENYPLPIKFVKVL